MFFHKRCPDKRLLRVRHLPIILIGKIWNDLNIFQMGDFCSDPDPARNEKFDATVTSVLLDLNVCLGPLNFDS